MIVDEKVGCYLRTELRNIKCGDCFMSTDGKYYIKTIETDDELEYTTCVDIKTGMIVRENDFSIVNLIASIFYVSNS